jgi:predicted ribosomally synthesized peptide with nif11-like leader
VSADDLMAFVVKARDDESVKNAMKGANSPDDIVALGAKLGHAFSLSDLSQTSLELAREDIPKLAVRRAGFRVQPFGQKHWFGWI